MTSANPLRVLHYNWVDHLDPENRGGGVTVYLRNLMAQLDEREDVDSAALSAGLVYDLPAGAPRWERVRTGPAQDRDRRYVLVNSGVLAPGHHSFGHDAQLSHPATEAAFCDMLERTGPWDVVHFHNLEGIPVATLGAVKARFPETRIVLSLHNYYPICPQVNLWQRETAHCNDYDDGRACVGCLLHQPSARLVTAAHGLSYRLQKLGMTPGTRLFDRSFGLAIRVGHRGSAAVAQLRRLRAGPARRNADWAIPAARPGGAPEAFARRRQAMIEAINDNADVVLGVSDRVGEIAAQYGVSRRKVRTCYIGTRHAELFARTRPQDSVLGPDGTLHLGFLGYMRRDKGFYFLLEALESLPDEVLSRLRLTVAARGGEAATLSRLKALGDRLAGLTHLAGYSQETLDTVLGPVAVGLIPVLWEDNLPQVAIEMHARHIPLLTSDRGGARELSGHDPMTFRSGDTGDFAFRIRSILEERIDWTAYWSHARAPQDMDGHLAELLSIYREGS